MALIIRSSNIHAAGCYTTARIRKGTFVVEYQGPRLSAEEGDRIYDGRPTTYLFGLRDNKHVIDGHGIAMFINHSCDPNCETDEIHGHVWIIALRDIRPGEELTYDYKLYSGDDDDPALCFCGSTNCRGTMYSEEEIRRRKRTKANTLRRRSGQAAVTKLKTRGHGQP
jgi:SET domain-containing protein